MRYFIPLIALAFTLSAAISHAEEQEQKDEATTAAPAAPAPPVASMYPFPMTSAMQRSMQNPMAGCGGCHSGDDMVRFDKAFRPMMAMMNPANWMNPNAYMAMMTQMMNPAMYTEWMNAYMKKYGMFLDPSQYQAQSSGDAKK